MRRYQWVLFWVLTFSAHAWAAPIALFSTGVDPAGAALSPGDTDPHYTVVETGSPAILVTPHPAWLPNTTTSAWIWETSAGTPVNVTRTFRTTFDLTGLIPSTAQIVARWATDNQGLDMLLNGVSTGLSNTLQFGAWTDFTLTSGFVAGVNTLEFVVQDVGSIAGLRVEVLSATADVAGASVPESGPLGLLALGFLPVALARLGSKSRAARVRHIA